MAAYISDFYKNQTILITGGTGFLGKILVEKLLRSCYDLKKIYLLIRPKQGLLPQERVNTLFSYPCFDKLKAEKPHFREKIAIINGDCAKKRLNLTDCDWSMLKQQINVIIHTAANVKFDQSLREVANNVIGVRNILQLARELADLKVFVHVSTAYSNCPQSHIAERFYKPPMGGNEFLQLLDLVDDDGILENITPGLLGKWPNSYAYSKSIAEDVVRMEAETFPVAIIRPAIVSATAKEPLPGWIDNFYGVAGIGQLMFLGEIRSVHAKKNVPFYIVPCDYVVNVIIAAGWDVYSNRFHHNNNVTIYNYIGSNKNPLTVEQQVNYIQKFYWDFPLTQMLWYPKCSIYENRIHHEITAYFLHTVRARFVDAIMTILRKPTFAVKMSERIKKLLHFTSFFARTSWTFDTTNVDDLWTKMAEMDRDSFPFNMDDFKWWEFIRNSLLGGRIYLMKDPVGTISSARRKMAIFAVFHYSMMIGLCYMLYRLTLKGLGCLF